MNGANNGYGFDAARVSPPRAGGASARKGLFEGYRKDALDNFEAERPRYNPLNPERPQSSALVDLKDPIQVHLLTETALSDSKEYEILSQEEVDELKKQVQSLTQRIENTRSNLAIQAKYRDAAISMSKLYTPAKKKGLLGNRNSGEESAREAEQERMASEKRCEELSSELFSLEKRLMEPQRRLLQHTAGILQLTHRAPKRPSQPSQTQAGGLPGIPGSPESLYTYADGRNSLEPSLDDQYFDDRSLYLPMDQLDGPINLLRKNAIDIPMKSPVREQANQLREENSRLKEEVDQMRAMSDALNLEADALRRQNADHLKVVSYTERKLGDLTSRLRELIVNFSPTRNANYKRPPAGVGSAAERSLEPGDLIASQLDYLQSGLVAAQQEQELLDAPSVSLTQAETKVEGLNQQIRAMLQSSNPDQPPPPQAVGSGASLDAQLEYLETVLPALSASTPANKQKDEQTETVLTGLWDIIQTGYAGIQQRKADRRRTRVEMGLAADEDDMSGDEQLNTDEPYSLSAFSTKVQWLYAQATSLKEQKSVLKRQIKQQRELNNKSDTDKELELKQKTGELQETKDMVGRMEQEAKDAQAKLARALEELEVMRVASVASQATAVQAVQDQLRERNAQMASLESESATLRDKLSMLDSTVATLQAQATAAGSAQKTAEDMANKLQTDLQAKDAELEQATLTLAGLKTEVTIAKAELEGAYGSRAQRAAEAAALMKATAKGGSEADAETIAKLKVELASTLTDFEDMTRDSIAAEREKLELEGRLDDALAAKAALDGEARALRERLDSEVARLQEQLDAERLKAATGGAGAGVAGRSGATMLSEQFRATMKEERRKFQEDMREELGKRRKLEEELRALKKAQGPGRSPLGPLSPR